MDNFMTPGFGLKKRNSPTQPDSFQKELKAKMKERKKRGLVAEITPSASERESDDELGSDEELMAHFNMTSKHDNKKRSDSWKSPDLRRTPTYDRTSPSSTRSKSPHDRHSMSPSSVSFGGKTPSSISDEDEDDDDNDGLNGPSSLMMTMKKPMKRMDFTRRDGTKTMPLLRKSKTLVSVNEDEPKAERKWNPPSAKKVTEDEKENRPMRPKSPNVRGRRTPTNLLDCIEEESKPKPSPRIKKKDALDSFSRPVPKPRSRSPKDHFSEEEEESEDEEIVKLSSGKQTTQRGFFKSRSSVDSYDGRMAGDRNYDARVAGDRKTPSSDRKTPSSERNTPSDGRRTPSGGRRTPSEGRKTPSEGRKTPSDSRINPSDGRKTPSDGRKTPSDGRKTPSDGRKTPSDGRKTPTGRKTPSDERRTPSDGGKSPEAKKSMFSRKASTDGIFGRKTPTEESKNKKISFGENETTNEDASPKVQKKSVLDMFSAGSKETNKAKAASKRQKSLLAESDSDSDMGIGAPRKSPSPLMRHQSSDKESRKSPTAARRRESRSDSHGGHMDCDKVDGMRMSPSVNYKDHERASPNFRRPSLKNRSGSPSDSLEQGPQHENKRKPSLSRNDAMDHDEYEDLQEKTSDRSRHKTRQRIPERESSVCRDIDVDPTMVKQKENIKERQLAKSHTANNRMLEDAIISVEDAQDNRMKYIEPDRTTDKEPQKEVSKKTPRHCPKPRYAKPVINTMPSPMSSSLSFNSTTDIRTAVYQEWYREQLEKAKKELKEKKQREKELEKKKIEAKKEKLFEAKASYQAWLEKKKETLKREKMEKKQKEEEEAKKKKWEEEEKRKELECTFMSWKEKKDAMIRRELMRKKREEEKKKQEEQEKLRQKNYSSKSALESWKEKKDVQIKTQKIVEKKTKKQKEEEERKAQEERERIALESYLEWLDKKEKQMSQMKKRRRQRDEENHTRPWFPASPTIPFGR